MTAPRCEITELPVDGCQHCRHHERPYTPAEFGLEAGPPDPAPVDLVQAPDIQEAT